MPKRCSKKLFLFLFLILSIVAFSQVSFAQSSDPDSPTLISNGIIAGESNWSASDKKTFYYSFDVKPGTLTLTTDIDPAKGTGGGLINWTYLDAKFRRLKTDVYYAQGAPERKINDAKITIKRKVILKLEVEGFHNYKMRFSGSAFVQ